MARRVSWTNNSSGYSGTYVYRAETLDPQSLPAPVATVDPVAQGATAEWVDNSGEYGCFAVQDFDGQGAGSLSAEVCVSNPAEGPHWIASVHFNSPSLTLVKTDDLTATVNGTPTMPTTAQSVAISPDSAFIAYGSTASPYVEIVDTSDWSIISGTPTLSGSGVDLAISSQGVS